MSDKQPIITKDLIDYLETICPDGSPSLDTPEREIWYRAGKVNLVRHLRSLHELQTTSVLSGEI